MEEDLKVEVEGGDQAKQVGGLGEETEEDSLEVVETEAVEGGLEMAVEEAPAEATEEVVGTVVVDAEEDAAHKRSSTIPQLSTP